MSNEKPTWVQCLDMAGEVLKDTSGVSDPALRDMINHTAYAWMALSRQYKDAPEPNDGTVITTLVNDLLQRVEQLEPNDDSVVVTALIDAVDDLSRNISDLMQRVERVEIAIWGDK